MIVLAWLAEVSPDLKIELHVILHRPFTHKKMINHSSVINILCQPIREFLTSECHHLSKLLVQITCRSLSFKTIISNILLLFFQDHHMKQHYFAVKTIFLSQSKDAPCSSVLYQVTHKDTYFKTTILYEKQRLNCQRQQIWIAKGKY